MGTQHSIGAIRQQTKKSFQRLKTVTNFYTNSVEKAILLVSLSSHCSGGSDEVSSMPT